jgi:hypothetical protein
MKIVFDLDGTLCTNTDGNYSDAKPLSTRISRVNQLYDDGNHITIFTARGMGRSGDDPVEAEKKFIDLTRDQLNRWGVKYHRLILGKPSADLYIDAKGDKDVDLLKDKG